MHKMICRGGEWDGGGNRPRQLGSPSGNLLPHVLQVPVPVSYRRKGLLQSGSVSAASPQA